MKKSVSIITAAAVALTSFGIAAAPASAASVQITAGDAQVVQVARRDRHDHGRFERHGSYAYYNGHRGYKQRHRGYRYYNGYWFPPAAFIIGGIIGHILTHHD